MTTRGSRRCTWPPRKVLTVSCACDSMRAPIPQSATANTTATRSAGRSTGAIRRNRTGARSRKSSEHTAPENVLHEVRKLWALALLLVACTNRVAPHPLGDSIVVIGDSVAHGAGDETGRGIARNLPHAQNLGINGARTANVLRLLRTPEAQRAVGAARAVIVSIGGNDLYGDRRAQIVTGVCPSCSMRFVLPRVRAVIDRLHRINPAARIVLLGLYNPYRDHTFLDRQTNAWDARLIERFASDRYVDVVRIADVMRSSAAISSIDHFHPSAIGYALIAARVRPALSSTNAVYDQRSPQARQ